MGYVKWSYDTLNTFCHDVFRKFGFNEEETNIIKDVLLTADLYGIESHGMQRMVRYDKGIEKGTIHPDAKPEVVFETPVSAVIDGHDGMGQLISHFAMEKAIEKAKKTGVGFVSVRNSNHFGIAGYYAEMASKQGLLGMACTNSEAIMVPTTVVTRGKLEMYNKMGKPLPQGWALGANGQESTDAPDVLANIVAKKGGGIMPLGGNKEVNGSHKGYGYGMLCEIFSSIFSMGVTSDKCCTFKDKTGICHGFAAIDPAIFGNADDIRAHFSEYLETLRQSPKAEGAEQIYTHGEKEVFAEKERRENGIPVNDNTMVELANLCNYLKVDFGSYFKGYELPKDSKFFSGNY